MDGSPACSDGESNDSERMRTLGERVCGATTLVAMLEWLGGVAITRTGAGRETGQPRRQYYIPSLRLISILTTSCMGPVRGPASGVCDHATTFAIDARLQCFWGPLFGQGAHTAGERDLPMVRS